MGVGRNLKNGSPRAVLGSLFVCGLLITGTLGSAVVQAGRAEAAPTVWSIVSSPNVSGVESSSLQGVSCISPTDCTAVGESTSNNYFVEKTLIESWNGTSWSIIPSPDPSGATDSDLQNVSCLSSTDCTAVGESSSDSFSTFQTLVESWNGTSWSIIPSPDPSGATASDLQSVSCLSSTDCTAVGYFVVTSAETLVESWDGTAWSIIPSPNPDGVVVSYLLSVSCLSTTNCTAVGDFTYESESPQPGQTLVESWDGTSWSIVPSPDPSGATASDLQSVSCLSSTDCTAVGNYDVNTLVQTLVESWDGTSWSIIPSPDPGDANASVLASVSCLSSTDCTAVGRSVNMSAQTLVESWDGTSWSIVPSPDPSGATPNGLQSVSCLSFTDCTAVGGSSNGTLVETSSFAIISSDSTTFTLGQPGSFIVTTTSAAVPSLAELGSIPNGVTFTDNGDGTATLAGTPGPGAAGAYPITITASDSVDPDVTQDFTLTVNRAPQTVAFTSTNPSPVIVGAPSYTPTTARGHSTSPVVISLDTDSTGCTLAIGMVHFTAPGRCVLDANQAGDGNYLPAPQVQQIITVYQTPSFTGGSSTTFIEGSHGSFTVKVKGYPTPTISETGTLPKGVKFVRGVLSGTPTQSGNFPITLTASNGFGNPAKEKFTLSVVKAPPVITSVNTTTFIKGSYGSFTVKATGYPRPTFMKTGTLPSGVTLSSAGVLSGTPKVTGRFSITIKATNSLGMSSQSFVLYVVSS